MWSRAGSLECMLQLNDVACRRGLTGCDNVFSVRIYDCAAPRAVPNWIGDKQVLNIIIIIIIRKISHIIRLDPF